MPLSHAAKIGLSVTVQNDPIHLPLRRWAIGFPELGFGRVEVDCWVVPVESYGPGNALRGRLPCSACVVVAVMRSHAISTTYYYINWAGQVSPLQVR